MSAVVTPSFVTKQNEVGVYFFSMDPMKVPVHKIQSHFIICVMEFVLTLSMNE